MIIDSHLHIWSEDVSRYPRRETPYPGSVELLLQYMDEAEVDRAVIVLPQCYRYDNRILADTLRRHGETFAGVGVIDPRGESAADALSRLVEEEGIGGVRLRAPLEPEWFCHPETEPLWRRAAELEVPLCLLARPERVRAIKRMVERHPQTPVVIDHFVMIPASDGIDCQPFRDFISLSEFPRVFIKFSGLHYWGDDPYPYRQAQVNLRAAFEAYGAKRILWGSDWPHILFGGGYIRSLNFYRRELPWLSEDDRAEILGGTAERLWWG